MKSVTKHHQASPSIDAGGKCTFNRHSWDGPSCGCSPDPDIAPVSNEGTRAERGKSFPRGAPMQHLEII